MPRSSRSSAASSASGVSQGGYSAAGYSAGGSAAGYRPAGYSAAGSRNSISTPREPKSRMVLDAIPGYGGYLPGAHAGNHYGTTWTRTNKHAANDLQRGSKKVILDKSTHLPGAHEQVRPAPRKDSTRESPGYNTGATVPRYEGFVPGVIAGNLISTSTPRAAQNNWCHVAHGTNLEKIGHRGKHGEHLDKIGH